MPAAPESKTGPLIACYRTRPLRLGGLLLYGALGAAAVLGPLFYGLWLRQHSLARYGPVAAEAWSRPWLVGAAAGLGLFTLLVLVRLAAGRRYFALYRSGLQSGPGKQPFLPWTQVEGLATCTEEYTWAGRSVLRYRAVLYPTTGRPLALPAETENLPELLTRLKAVLYPRLAPALRQEIKAGRWAHFGPLAISQLGLRLGSGQTRRELAWKQIGGLEVKNGHLLIEFTPGEAPAGQTGNQRAHLHSLPAGQVPNLELLLQLIREEVTA